MPLKKKGNKSEKNRPMHYLILLDHDGTLCDTNPCAYDSIKFAIQTACNAIDIEFKDMNYNFDTLFAQTQGTTEKNLVKSFCFQYSIPLYKMELFEQRFYAARNLWYKNMKHYKENTYDTYYPDAENLIHICRHSKNVHIMLVTGNPHSVMKERLASHLYDYFCDDKGDLLGAFGNEAYSREDLIKIAIDRAKYHYKNFEVIMDDMGFAKNIIYLGDGRADFFAALHSQVISGWIPSRKLQEMQEVLSHDYMIFLKKFFGGRVIVSNRCDSEEVLQLIGIE